MREFWSTGGGFPWTVETQPSNTRDPPPPGPKGDTFRACLGPFSLCSGAPMDLCLWVAVGLGYRSFDAMHLMGFGIKLLSRLPRRVVVSLDS